MIESYSKMIERQNRQLQREKERAEKLLLNIMPKTVYDELKAFGITTPQRFDDASILMLDFVGFTEMALHEDPQALIAELNDLFTAFDRIAEQFGLRADQGPSATPIWRSAASPIDARPRPEHRQGGAPDPALPDPPQPHPCPAVAGADRHRVRGPVIGSIVGVQKYVYDIFGPGVNLAARMEALAGPMEIVVAERPVRPGARRFPLRRARAMGGGQGLRPPGRCSPSWAGGDVPAF